MSFGSPAYGPYSLCGPVLFVKLAETYSQMCIHSHGDHISRDLRYCATFAWWLPDLLAFDYTTLQDSSERRAFWKPRLEALGILADYVRKAVPVFEWPDASTLCRQYKVLILHWQKVADKRAVRERIWKSNHQKAVLFSVPGSQGDGSHECGVQR